MGLFDWLFGAQVKPPGMGGDIYKTPHGISFSHDNYYHYTPRAIPDSTTGNLAVLPATSLFSPLQEPYGKGILFKQQFLATSRCSTTTNDRLPTVNIGEYLAGQIQYQPLLQQK
jgi:hypothetical protein